MGKLIWKIEYSSTKESSFSLCGLVASFCNAPECPTAKRERSDENIKEAEKILLFILSAKLFVGDDFCSLCVRYSKNGSVFNNFDSVSSNNGMKD